MDEFCERFLSKVMPEPNSGCWLWVGTVNDRGYGTFWNGKKTYRAHRFSYEMHIGPIKEGLEIDHLCRIKTCVNPDHLEAVTHRENVLRGNAGQEFAEKQRSKTHCPQGHPYSGNNLYINPLGHRGCRICKKDTMRRFYERKNR